MFTAAKTDLQNDIAHSNRKQLRKFDARMVIQIERECWQNTRDQVLSLRTQVVISGAPQQILTNGAAVTQELSSNAVPPFSAKHFSSPTMGKTRTNKLTCRLYGALSIICKLFRHRDQIFRIQLAAGDDHALAFSQVDCFDFEFLEPGMIMSLG